MSSKIAKVVTLLIFTLLMHLAVFCQYESRRYGSGAGFGLSDSDKLFTKEEVEQQIKIIETSENNHEILTVLRIISNSENPSVFSPAVPTLIVFLENPPNNDIFFATFKALGNIGKEAKDAVPIIIKIMKKYPESEVILRETLSSLGGIGEVAKDAAPLIINLIKDSTKSEDLRKDAIKVLGKLGKGSIDTVPVLITTINTDPYNARYAFDALIELGENAKDAVPFLINIVEKRGSYYDEATELLGKIGRDAKSALPVLFKVHSKTKNDPSLERELYFNAIFKILNDLTIKKDYSENKTIRDLFAQYEAKLDDKEKILIANLIITLQEREKLENLQKATPIKDFVIEHYLGSSALALVLLTIFFWIFVFLTKPIWLISFHEYLWANSLMANFKHILEFPIISLISTVCIRPRTMDSWIRSNLETARESFNEKQTIKERNLYIPVKVSYKNDNTDFVSQTFQEVFEKKQSQLLIYGDGGSGKTSLACQMAKWALDKRLFEEYYALPVLIENSVKDIQKTISLEIKSLTSSETTISDALQKALLRKKRILLIVDGLSELDEETKQQIINNPDINAVVYTSRNDETKDIPKVATNYLSGGTVTDFLEKYIEESIGKEEKEKLFDKTIFDYNSGDLKKLVGEKEINILMAKLYAEQMIVQKQGTSSNDLPKNVPDLMIQSIRILHEKKIYKKLEFSEVVKVSKITANESLKQDYRPIPANKDDVKKALEVIKDGKDVFSHLRNNLKIIEEKGIAEDKIAFKLDPLAEYLAAIYLVEENKDDVKKWNAFLKDAKKKSNEENNIKGFLVAVKDCCEMSGDIDKSIVEKLNKIIEN